MVLLAASGLALAVLKSGSFSALARSQYGALLAAKLALVAALLALAARNRLILTPRLARGTPGAASALRHAVIAEVIIGLLILAISSGFRLSPPPRALAVAEPPARVHLHGRAAMIDMELAPGHAGINEITMFVQSTDFSALTPQEVEIAFALPGRGVESIRSAATSAEDGVWRAPAVLLPLPGRWQVTVLAIAP